MLLDCPDMLTKPFSVGTMRPEVFHNNFEFIQSLDFEHE